MDRDALEPIAGAESPARAAPPPPTRSPRSRQARPAILSDKELPFASLPGKAFIQNLPEGDVTNKPGAPQLAKPTNLVTETLRTVNSNIGSIAQAKKFGSKMGIGTLQMISLSMGYGEWHNYL